MESDYKIRGTALDIAKSLQDASLTVSEAFEALRRAKEICRIALHDDTATESGASMAAE